jgi:hypothetical protein
VLRRAERDTVAEQMLACYLADELCLAGMRCLSTFHQDPRYLVHLRKRQAVATRAG